MLAVGGIVIRMNARQPLAAPRATGLSGGEIEMPAKDRQFANTLARGLEVLRCFRVGDALLGNKEIAQRTGLPKATVSRLTHTLIELGYAAALGKRIGIGIGRSIKIEEFEDLWMARQCCTMGVWLGTPRETFDEFMGTAAFMGTTVHGRGLRDVTP